VTDLDRCDNNNNNNTIPITTTMVSVSLSLTLVEITKLNTINEKRPSLMKPLEEKKPLL